MAIEMHLREQLDLASRRVGELETECRRLRRLAEECDRERGRRTAYVQTHNEDGGLNLVITCPREDDERSFLEFACSAINAIEACARVTRTDMTEKQAVTSLVKVGDTAALSSPASP